MADTKDIQVVTIPGPNQKASYTPEQGHVFQIDFDLGEQTSTLTGGDLRIDFENGAVLIFEDFASADNLGNTPMFEMMDGSVIPGTVLLALLAGEPEEATAAGEVGGDSGGVGEYDDDMGNILGGIDKLGIQDPDTYPTEQTEELDEESPPPIASDDDAVLVYENALDENQDGLDLAPGTVTGSLPGSTAETDATQTLADNVAGSTLPLTFSLVGSPEGEHGTIQINPDGTYIYTLTSPVDGPTANNGANIEDNADSFTYQVTDAAGNTSTATIYINIVDDVPSVDVTPGEVQDVPSVTTQDADTIGEDFDTDSGYFNGLFNLSYEMGADVDGGTVPELGYSLSYSTNVTDLSSGGLPVTLSMDGEDIVGSTTAGPVFRISVDAESGQVTLTQYVQIDHLPEDADGVNDNANLGLADGNVLLTASATIIDGDGDIDTDSETVDISDYLSFDDDLPEVSATDAYYDEEALNGNPGDSYEGEYAEGTPNDDMADDTVNVTGALAIDYGADGAADSGALMIELTNAEDVYTAAGDLVSWDSATNTGYINFGESDQAAAFSITVGDGTYTYSQSMALEHDVDDAEDDLVLNFEAIVEDADGDIHSATFSVTVDDDAPVITGSTNLVYANSNNQTTGGTGIFDYSIGADVNTYADGTHSDFSPISLSGMVGDTEIFDQSVTLNTEDDSSAVFDVAFSYYADPAGSVEMDASGTLTFDKADGTYTLNLATPLESYTIYSTSDPSTTFQGYEYDSGDTDKTQPEVSVAELADNFFVQFTGAEDKGVDLTAGDDDVFVDGELFAAADTWVSTSGSANGVAGDTMQGGEVLDLNFYASNPTGDLSYDDPTTASGIFLTFDGIGATEDLLVVLKLVDPDGLHTTRAVIVESSDIIKSQADVPDGYNVTLDSNDGLVIIESNDYNIDPDDNYQIEGMQILTSVEDISGFGIDLNPEGASSSTTAFTAAETDTDVIKISSIGFVAQSSATLDANLEFDFNVIDADGDQSAPQTLDVTIIGGDTFEGASTDTAESIYGSDSDDFLVGGGGNDILFGGDGADTFVYDTSTNEGQDSISDFNPGADILSFHELLGADDDGIETALGEMTDEEIAFAQSVDISIDGIDVTLTITEGDAAGTSITLEGINGEDQFIAYDTGTATLADLIGDGSLNVDINPDTFAS